MARVRNVLTEKEKKEYVSMVLRVAEKDPLLMQELQRVGFDPEQFPEAYVSYMVKKGDPFVVELLQAARYTHAVAIYLDYLHRTNKPIKRSRLLQIAAHLTAMGYREDTGIRCHDLYINGFIYGRGLPYRARLDACPQWATAVILYYCDSPHCRKQLRVED
jgi:hypothetical protein